MVNIRKNETILHAQFKEFTRLLKNFELGYEEEIDLLAYEVGVSKEDFINNLYEKMEFLKLRMFDEDYKLSQGIDDNRFIPKWDDALQDDWEPLEMLEDEDTYLSKSGQAYRQVYNDYEGY